MLRQQNGRRGDHVEQGSALCSQASSAVHRSATFGFRDHLLMGDLRPFPPSLLLRGSCFMESAIIQWGVVCFRLLVRHTAFG